MTVHYSCYNLNTYLHTPYFRQHIPKGYALDDILIKSRAFRRLPPNLRKLSQLSKQWSQVSKYKPGSVDGIDNYYDDKGNELDPTTKKPMTDQEIDDYWDMITAGEKNDTKVTDIPHPQGGFPDPNKWTPKHTGDDVSVIDRSDIDEQIVRQDAESRGVNRAAEHYGVPLRWLSKIKTPEQLAKAVMSMHGRPHPGDDDEGTNLSLD